MSGSISLVSGGDEDIVPSKRKQFRHDILFASRHCLSRGIAKIDGLKYADLSRLWAESDVKPTHRAVGGSSGDSDLHHDSAGAGSWVSGHCGYVAANPELSSICYVSR